MMKKLSRRSTMLLGLALVMTSEALSIPTTVASSQPSHMPAAFIHRSRKRQSNVRDSPTASSRTSLRVLQKRKKNHELMSQTAAAPLLATTALVLPVLAGAAAQALLSGAPAQDPVMEAEVLTDLAHMTLDVATLFGPSKLGIRLSNIIGRLLCMAADYVPDHTILPEEMVFQLAMLCVASIGFCKSALPVLLAAGSSVSLRQAKAYRNLLAPTGMSWHQFKAMDVLCMDWITVEAGEMLEDSISDKCVYWLYSGDVMVYSEQEKSLYNLTSASGKAAAEAVLGEAQLIHKKKNVAFETVSLPTSVQAGSQGATLLRINVPKLRVLMTADKDLEECMRTLAFQSLQSKLKAQFAEA